MSIAITTAAFAALVMLVVTCGGLLEYAMEVRRAAERTYSEAERAVFWSELQVAFNTGPRWRGTLLQQIHRLVGGLVAEGGNLR